MAHQRLGRYNSWFIFAALGFCVIQILPVWAQTSAFTDEPRELQVVEGSLNIRDGESPDGFLALPESTLELEMWRAREGNDSARRWWARTRSQAPSLSVVDKKMAAGGSLREQVGVLTRYATSAQISGESRLLDASRALADRVARGEYLSEKAASKPKDASLVVVALSQLYATTLNTSVLAMAEKWAEKLWKDSEDEPVVAKENEAQQALGSIDVGQACLALYEVTAKREWLTRASQAFARVSAAHLSQLDASSVADMARISARLFRYSGDGHAEKVARLGIASVRQRSGVGPADTATLLLAERGLAVEPAHVTVVGGKDDARARALWRESLVAPSLYVRREWWDRSEGNLPRNDANFPILATPAAYVCVQKRCSLPLFTEEELRAKLTQVFPPL